MNQCMAADDEANQSRVQLSNLVVVEILIRGGIDKLYSGHYQF